MRPIKQKHFFQNIKIKHQLLMLVIFSMVITAFVQLAYFHKFSSVIRSLTQDSASNLLVQLEENLSIQVDSIIETANNIAYDSYTQEFMGSENYAMRAMQVKFIQNLFDFSIIANPDITDIILVDHLGQVVRYANGPDWGTVEYILKNYPASSDGPSGSGEFYLIDSGTVSLYLYAFPFSTYRDLNNEEACYILFENDSFQNMLENTTLPASTQFYLLDQKNQILASHDSSLIGTPVSPDVLDLISSTKPQSTTKFQEESCLVNHSRIPGMSWTLVSIIPQAELEQPLIPLKAFGIVFGVLMLLILLAICISIISNIARPLGELSAFLSDVNYQTLKKRLRSTGNNEIDQVISKMNTMMEEIQTLTHKIFTTQQQFYELELSKKQAEFHALQNQINPHFLYNTLDCIRSIAYSYQASEIVSISSSMSKIFRYCIKESHTVLVRDELDCIDNYIKIIQIRYDNRFHIEREIDPELYELPMIKFILQPLIENAVYHGLELKLGSGSLRITGSKSTDCDFSFEIYDTGIGIQPEKLSQINARLANSSLLPESEDSKHTGVGLYNINRRIKSIYGSKYGLQVDSVYGEWTQVLVLLRTMPLS